MIFYGWRQTTTTRQDNNLAKLEASLAQAEAEVGAVAKADQYLLPESSIWRVTIWEQWLSQVVGNGEAHDGVGGGDEDEDGVPKVEEGRQTPKSLPNVSIVTP